MDGALKTLKFYWWELIEDKVYKWLYDLVLVADHCRWEQDIVKTGRYRVNSDDHIGGHELSNNHNTEKGSQTNWW